MRQALALAALGVCAASSFAQTVDKPFSINVGLNLATHRESRNNFANTGLFAALEYRFIPTSFIDPERGEPALQLGFSRLGGGNHLDMWSLMYVERFRMSETNSQGGSFYAGFGLGLGLMNLRYDNGSGNGGNGNGEGEGEGENTDVRALRVGNGVGVVSEKGLRPMGQLMLGYRMNDRTRVELAYRITGSLEGQRMDGFLFSVGFRF